MVRLFTGLLATGAMLITAGSAPMTGALSDASGVDLAAVKASVIDELDTMKEGTTGLRAEHRGKGRSAVLVREGRRVRPRGGHLQ